MKLDDTVAAVVTGGASGLGLASAKALADQGVKVAIFDVNEDAGKATADAHGFTFCKVDVTSDDSVDAGFAAARAAHGQERVLINCAGIAPAAKTAGRDRKTGQIARHPMQMFETVMQINLIGSFRCIAASAAGMLELDPIEGERGAIVNTASVAAEDGQMGQVAYASSKAGVVGMTLPVARDLAKENIRVNTIMPGIFGTPLLLGLPDEVQASLAAQVPNPSRLGDPAEFASLAMEMLRNGYFNGAAVRLDGAIRMAPR